MLKRAYVEITNICNLRCEFCPGTKRARREMCEEEFQTIAMKLRGAVKYLYFHVMGEPLLHEKITNFLDVSGDLGFRVCLTTNGTLLGRRGNALLTHRALHKVSVSLHSMEGNGISDLRNYLEEVWKFSEKAAGSGVIVALRLWNIGGADEKNGEILAFLEEKLGAPPLSMPQPRDGNWKLREKIYLEQAERFEWPDLAAEEADVRFCLGLRQQIAVLCDGTVVPCCLDHEGDIPLGNLLTQELCEILSSPRAKALFDGFSDGKPSEELCRRCGYATRF
ncbi:MAG: SPASM domain-containing protein [Oscillospiraceae bacterium]|nr:SPASM domain-containing protein [Oscillospiraceae bacterium]